MLSGTIVGKIIAISAMPFLTRLYSPESFGYMGVLLSFTLIMAPVFHMGFAFALPLLKNDSNRVVIINSCLSLILLSTIILSTALFFLKLTGLINIDTIIIFFSIFACLITSIYELFSQSLIRGKGFNSLSLAIVMRNATNVVLKIVSFMFLPKLGILIGVVFQDLISSIYLAKIVSLRQQSRLKLGSLLTLKRFAYFPLYRLPSHLILILSAQIPILMTGYFFDIVSVGYLGLSLNLLMIPASMIANSLSQVFYSEILSFGKNRRDSIKLLMKKINIALFTISFIPLMIILFFGENIFLLIFGPEWEVAGLYSEILCFFILFQSVAVINIKIFHFLNMQRKILFFNIIRFFISFSVFAFFGSMGFDLETLLYIYSFLMSLYYLAISFYSYKILGD